MEEIGICAVWIFTIWISCLAFGLLAYIGGHAVKDVIDYWRR